MADKSGGSTFNTLLAFLIIGGLLVWLALVLTSQGEKRLEMACKPVEATTNLLHEVTTAVVGRQPTWTLYVQRYLMTGCYYTFSIVFAQQIPGTDDESFGGAETTADPTLGGIQQ